MKMRKGNMWTAWKTATLFCITTNSTLNARGELVMGRGIAKEAKAYFPTLPLVAGTRINEMGLVGKEYNLLVNAAFPDRPLALFQVKYHWQDMAGLDLIARSTEKLVWFIAQNNIDPTRVHLNMPGVGNGKLPFEEVKDLLNSKFRLLNINIWTK